MVKFLLKGLVFFSILLPVLGFGQAPYVDTTCSLASRICSGQTYTYPAWTGMHPSQSGPSYGCLSAHNDPAWFYFVAGNTGDVHIHMYSTPCRDIDFICWGPFTSLDAGCNGGLTASKIIDCSFGSPCIEDCDLNSMVNGQFYIMLITNYSMLSCTITFSQTSGSGIMQCVQSPTVSNNGPICTGQNLQLLCSTVPGGSYQWTGPSGFNSTMQNPVLTNATTLNSGTYSVVVTVGTLTLSPVNTTVVINPLPVPQIIAPSSICLNSSISIGGATTNGYTYTWASNPPGFTSSVSNPSVNPGSNTSYYLTVSSGPSCSATANTSITVNPLPTAFILPDATVCSGSQVPLGGNPNPNYTYAWTSNPPGFISNLANPVVSPLVTTTYTLLLTNQYSCTNTYTVTLTVSAPTLAVTGPNQTICSGNQVSLGATAVVGNTYSWSSNPSGFTSSLSNPTVSPTVTTIYTLTESNPSSGCSNTNSVTITVNQLPLAITGPNASICAGNSVNLGALPIAGNTYSWSSNPPGFSSTLSNPSVTPTITTTYTLTETVGGTCSVSHNVTITVNPLPLAVTGGPVSICDGSPISLGTYPIPGHTYTWSSFPPGFSSMLSNPTDYPSVTTTYFLTEIISATNCTATNSAVVTVNPLPTPGIIPSTSICLGNSIYIGAMPIPGNSYSWSSNPPGFTSSQPNPLVSPSVTTTYILVQTISSSGCSKTSSATIIVYPLPIAIAGNNCTICAGAQITIGGSAVAGNTYSWTSNPPGFTSSQANPIVSPVVTTTYSLTVTNSSGCSANQAVTITVGGGPAAYTGPNLSICSGSSVIIGTTAVPGNTYSWISSPPGFTSNLSNPLVSPTFTTSYSLTETSGSCSTTHTVSVSVSPPPAAITGGPFAMCVGGQITLGNYPIPGHTYSWVSNPPGFSSTLSNPIVSPSLTTTYTLTETITATNCTASNSVIVTVNPLPNPGIIPNTSICQGSSILIGGMPIPGNSYAWTSNPPGFTSSQANPLVSPTVTTTYYLTQTIVSTGCTKSANVTITVVTGLAVTLQAFPSICKDAAPLVLSGGSPPGGTYSGQGVNNGYFSPASLSPGTYPITYSYSNGQGCTASAVQSIQVVQKPKISGTLRYLNANNTLLDSCKTRLFNQSNLCLDSCVVVNGNYSFNCLQNATYKVRNTSSKAWGGGNAVDALMVAKYAVGLISFTDIQKKVADVNLSGSINSIDSYLIIRRWAGLINSFPAGNWYITKNDTVIINNQDVTQNFQALCYGDVDGSYLSGMSPAPEPNSKNITEPNKPSSLITNIELDIPGLSPGWYTVLYFNISDNTVVEIPTEIKFTSKNRLSVPADKLSPGFYVYEIQSGNGNILYTNILTIQ